MITISVLGLFWFILGVFVTGLSIILIISCLNNCEYGITIVGFFFLIISVLIILHSLNIIGLTA